MSISDDEVEAALNAWWGGKWPDASDYEMQDMRRDMRDALSAAAKVRAIREGDGEAAALRKQMNIVHGLAASARDRRSTATERAPDDLQAIVEASRPMIATSPIPATGGEKE